MSFAKLKDKLREFILYSPLKPFLTTFYFNKSTYLLECMFYICEREYKSENIINFNADSICCMGINGSHTALS